MAVTLLKHIKEAKNRDPSAHLKNSIKYIMNPKKTENGLWVGGNVGNDPETVFQAMIDTKNDYGKLHGRQGYHFVISFSPDESDTETTYLIGQEFCKRYLGDDYDYAFAVHNDHKHSHCHIVFNSVNRMGGSKYRYVDGDWKAIIQPLTDEICIKRGLEPLTYDPKKKKGKSYAERLAEKRGTLTGKDIIRLDIDHAIEKARSDEEFLSIMRSCGYRISQGHSEARGTEYLTFYAPGFQKGRRDYNLGEGYSLSDIRNRIAGILQFSPEYKMLPDRLQIQNLWLRNESVSFRRPYVLRVIYAVMYHSVDPILVDQTAVRKDLMDIQKLQEECSYLQENKITGVSQIEERMATIKQMERTARSQGDENQLNLIRAEKRIIRRILKDIEENEMRKELHREPVVAMQKEYPEIENSKIPEL